MPTFQAANGSPETENKHYLMARLDNQPLDASEVMTHPTSGVEGGGGPLLPAQPSFAGHQTFALRSGWLKKGLDALEENPRVFSEESALVTLGVGKNMVVAIRHWLLATRLAEVTDRELAPTKLGRWLLRDTGFDPYLEDPATLWLLHWNLCSAGNGAFSYVWAFSCCREWEWTAPGLAKGITGAVALGGATAKVPSDETVGRDVTVLLQSYVATEDRGQNAEDGLDCPLRDLGLIRPTYNQHYNFVVGPKASLPAAVFAWALVAFWQWRYPASAAVPVRDIAHGEGSPGMIFKLDEDSTLSYLDALDALTEGALRFEDTPLVRQVVATGPLPSAKGLLKLHYKSVQVLTSTN